MMRLPRPTLPLLVAALVAIAASAASPAGPTEELERIKILIDEAKDLGAQKRCPVFWDAAERAYKAAENMIVGDPPDGSGRAGPALEKADFEARRLVSRARFIQELRDERYGWEEAAEVYDRLVSSVATVTGVTVDPVLNGPDAGRALVDALDRQVRARRARMDSLSMINRGLQSWVDAERADADSTIDGLRDEITDLRHRLWAMELRAGVAEADRSAVEADLERAREREALVASLGKLFREGEGVVTLTPAGDVHVRLDGLKFASGSAWLDPEYDPLLDKLAEVIAKFPDAPVRVEGHTDDSGPRDGNLTLSESRARVVAAALAGKLDRPPEDFEVVGLGPDRPVANNGTAAGRARNRRIEVLIRASRGD